jgi:DNA-binding transcriptional regulator of glucitol operon
VRRVAIVVTCVLSLAGAGLLAWWQWTRFESASGSWQNLSYVLQWPLFGLFPAFLFWRIHRLTARQAAGEATAPAEPVRAPVQRRAVPADDIDDDPELAAYNRYLAQLNAREDHHAG